VTDWESVVREHGGMVTKAAFRVLGDASESEDAAQDAFLDALQFSAGRAVGNWSALLRTLAIRRALDRLRRRRIWQEPDGLIAPGCAGPERVAIARERTAMLRQALAELPSREAEVFAMRFFGEQSNQDIGEALGMSAGAVAVALHKAREKLQALVKE